MVDVLYGICDEFKTPFYLPQCFDDGIGGETAARVAARETSCAGSLERRGLQLRLWQPWPAGATPRARRN